MGSNHRLFPMAIRFILVSWRSWAKMVEHPIEHPHPIEGIDLPPAESFPHQGADESTEDYAERKRDWARKASERIQLQCWAAPGYVPE